MTDHPALFSSPEKEVKAAVQAEKIESENWEVINVPIGSLVPYPGHPFQVRDDDEMTALSMRILMSFVTIIRAPDLSL